MAINGFGGKGLKATQEFQHRQKKLHGIKMVINGRSPTTRHVSRTHRVALDWLFDRINMDSKIQNKYVDTKNQLADILTKGSFTRDEWNHLLCTSSCSHFSDQIDAPSTMSKRMQEKNKEEKMNAWLQNRDHCGILSR